MSSAPGLFAFLSLVARAAWVTAQTETPRMTTTRGLTPQPTGFSPPPSSPRTTGSNAGLPGGPPIGTPPPPTGTPFPPGACPYSSNSSQVGLVVFNGEPNLGNSGEIGSCSCDVGKKAFYASGPTADNLGAMYATFIELPPEKDECADFCIIDEAGDECKFSNTGAGFVMFLQPYCARGKSHMYVYLYGDETGSSGLICGTRNFTGLNQLNADGSTILMDPDTTPQAYVHAAAFTCKGCAAIRNSSCLKPTDGTTTTTPTATAKPGPDCGRIESFVQQDAANNTILTTALNAAWNGWSRPDKANFAMYKKRIEKAVYEPVESGAKISATSKILDDYAPDGSVAKDKILASSWALAGNRENLLEVHTDYPVDYHDSILRKLRLPDKFEPSSCSCDVGKKAFYASGPSAETCKGTYGTFVEFPKQKDGPLACADFCIIDEAGDECRFSNTSANMTIFFQPYCTKGKCHMYVYMGLSGDDTGSSNGLICSSRNFTQRDGWNEDGTLKPMDPDTSPQAFVHAAAFTCKGCAAIRTSNCVQPTSGTTSTPTTTTAAPACDYPKDTSQVALVFLEEDEPRQINASGILGSCSCDIGKKAFFNSVLSNDPYGERERTSGGVQYPTQKEECADLCIIDEVGDECKFSNTSASMTILFQPYCTRASCHMYVYMGFSGDETGSNGLVCGSRNFTQFNQWNTTGSMLPMDPDTSPQAYVHAAAFSCKGCAAIRNSNCLKPVAGTPGTPAPPTRTPAPPPGGTSSPRPGGMPGVPGVATPPPGGVPPAPAGAPSAPRVATPAPGESAAIADATASPKKRKLKKPSLPHRK